MEERALKLTEADNPLWSRDLFPYGHRSFLLFPIQNDARVSTKLVAAGATLQPGPLLPSGFDPRSIHGALMFGNVDRQAVALPLDNAQGSALARPFAPRYCGWIQAVSLSHHTIACYKDGRSSSLVIADDGAAIPLASIPNRQMLGVAVGDDGSLAKSEVQEHILVASPDGLVSDIRTPAASIEKLPARAISIIDQGRTARRLGAIVEEGTPGNFRQALVVLEQGVEHPLIDVQVDPGSDRIAPRPNTTMIGVMGSRQVLVFDIAHPESPLVISISVGDLHTINGAAWDASGEWLLVLGDSNAATLFRFVSKTAAR